MLEKLYRRTVDVPAVCIIKVWLSLFCGSVLTFQLFDIFNAWIPFILMIGSLIFSIVRIKYNGPNNFINRLLLSSNLFSLSIVASQILDQIGSTFFPN